MRRPIWGLRALLSLLLACLVFSGCTPGAPGVGPGPGGSGAPGAGSEPGSAGAGPEPGGSAGAGAPGGIVHAYTHLRPDGNRWATGRGSLPKARVLDIALGGRPEWIVAAPGGNGALWVAALADGTLRAFYVAGREALPVELAPGTLPAGAPPLLRLDGSSAGLLTMAGVASPLSHPVPLPGSGLAYVEPGGDLIVARGAETARLALGALPDARILADPAGRLLLLTGATRRYGHGALGDDVEAGAVTLVHTTPAVAVALTISVAPPAVIEGTAPIWADLDGDGRREIIVTVSGPDAGARLVAYDEAGSMVAQGPAAGQGFRWRHQIAVGPLGPAGELELVAVRTPHIGGVAEFYRLVDGELRIVAEAAGWSSHALGSRNLDQAMAADFDGDGRAELLVPSQDRTHLGGIRRTKAGAEVAWTVPLGGQLSSNLAAVALPSGRMAVGAGRDDGVLRIWLP